MLVVVTLNVQEFPERGAPVIQLNEFPKLSTISHEI